MRLFPSRPIDSVQCVPLPFLDTNNITDANGGKKATLILRPC